MSPQAVAGVVAKLFWATKKVGTHPGPCRLFHHDSVRHAFIWLLSQPLRLNPSPFRAGISPLYQGYSPRTVYHVALMPCFDKKLEASRDQLRVPGEASGSADGSADMVTDRAADTVPGTDLVLTTGEVRFK